jgi:hypothetical protein
VGESSASYRRAGGRRLGEQALWVAGRTRKRPPSRWQPRKRDLPLQSHWTVASESGRLEHMTRTPTLFNDLISSAGISPGEVRLLRHHTDPGLGGQSLHDLWLQNREGFELYQSTQEAGRKLFRTGKIWSAFVSPTPGVSLFVGLYEAEFIETKSVDWQCPYRGDRPGAGEEVDVYRTVLRAELAKHVGTLTVEWDPASVRTWARYAADAPFPATIGAYPPASLITDLEDLDSNLIAFDQLRRDRDHPEHNSYLGFLQRGHCLIPYYAADGIAFAASRLVGYKGNSLVRHAANLNKDGRDTDASISRILGTTYAEDKHLDEVYRVFCREHGIAIQARKRKFWPIHKIKISAPLAEPQPSHFEVGALYSRPEIAELLGLPAPRGGNWDTGYARVREEFFVFANVGSKGRTGHDYPNRWDGKQLVWSGKAGTKLGQKEITAMLSGGTVHIFWRAAERAPFTYAGIGTPIEVEDTTPVRVRWAFEERREDASSADGSSTNSRRGPPPVAGARTTVYADGPTSVYLLELIGPIPELFPKLPAGHRVVKIGMSNDTLRRVSDLSCGLPPGCELRWQVVATRLLGSGKEAFDVETTLIERARAHGWLLGGEFAAVSDDDLSVLSRLA